LPDAPSRSAKGVGTVHCPTPACPAHRLLIRISRHAWPTSLGRGLFSTPSIPAPSRCCRDGTVAAAIGLSGALGGGKVSAVAWLGRPRGSPVLRTVLVVLGAVLMALNAVGAYGFLAKAHIGHALAGDLAVAGRAAEIESRMSVQSGVVTDFDRRIAQ